MPYLVTITDTFGSELNYSWVKRFLVESDTIPKAVKKVSAYEGYKTRKEWNIGEENAVYKVIGANIAYDVQWIDSPEIESLHYVYVKI